MTDSEKLDLLLVEMQEMKTEVKEINQRVTQLEKKVDRLAVEETKTQGELFKIDRKIENVYGVALDALAATAENRKWLETGTGTLI
jgi:tetrahydromethanopterin S-methyltransferase subunit G